MELLAFWTLRIPLLSLGILNTIPKWEMLLSRILQEIAALKYRDFSHHVLFTRTWYPDETLDPGDAGPS